MLAISACSKRIAYVFFMGDDLRDWRVSETAARGPNEAATHTQIWVNELKPEVVVTEKIAAAKKKGEKAKNLIAAVARTAEHNYVLDVSVDRPDIHANKYDEAAALAGRYPELKAWLPRKRRFFENEPRSIVLFEALALAEQVRQGPPAALAAAMG